MSQRTIWAVLVPGKFSWVEAHARSALVLEEDEEDAREPSFKVLMGSGHYHAIVGLDPIDLGAEMQIAEALSLECHEPVYSLEQASHVWLVMSFHHGVGQVEEKDPETLAMSLGCPLPGSEEPSVPSARKLLRTVALVEGVRAQQAHQVLEEEAGHPLAPGHYRMEETPRGLLLAGGTGWMGFAYVTVSERIPHATVYAVTASPDLDIFIVKVLRGLEGLGQFSQPPHENNFLPPVDNIKGERSPERILAALGIPAVWFLNE
jgi:hypothetical protein